MTWRRVILYYVLLGIAVFYYFVSAPERRRLGDTDEAAVALVDVRLDRLNQIHVMRDGDSVRCRQEGIRWRVIEPEGVWLPADLISSFVVSLVETKAVEVIAGQERTDAAFGFGRGATRVQLYRRGHEAPVTVVLGGRNPTQTAVYARVEGAAQILLVGRILLYYADRMFDELRRQRSEDSDAELDNPGAAGSPVVRSRLESLRALPGARRVIAVNRALGARLPRAARHAIDRAS